MNRGVIIYASLLLIALLGAYLSWTHEPDEKRASGVVLVDVELDYLESLSYAEGDEFAVKVMPRKDERGDFVWVETRRQVAKQAGGHGHGHSEKDDAEKTLEMLAFKAGTNVEPVMAKVAPFMAIRKIEDVDGRLQEFGLDASKTTLTLTPRGEKARTFEVGKEGYGHRNIYVRDTSDGAIYLVDGQSVRPLQNADARLPERRLVDLNPSVIVAATVRSGDRSRTFEQRNRDDRQKSFWAASGAEERNRSAEAWIEKVLRMRSLNYVPSDFNADGLESSLQVDVKADDETLRVEIFRGQDEEGREQWYGKSELTRGLVELPLALAADLAQDVATIFEESGSAGEVEASPKSSE